MCQGEGDTITSSYCLGHKFFFLLQAISKEEALGSQNNHRLLPVGLWA